jgi:DNA-binding beta-propeller fold protein YncE
MPSLEEGWRVPPVRSYIARRRSGRIVGKAGCRLLEDPWRGGKIGGDAERDIQPMANQSWIITTAVGTGERGYRGDGGPAAEALLNGPFDVGFDAGGNLYFSDTFNHCIRRVDARTAVITTCAGCGEAGYSGDGGPAIRARFNEPYGIAVDIAGNIYIADRHNHCVRRFDRALGIVMAFAGNGSSGFGGDGEAASCAAMVEPNGLAFDPAQRRLFIADVADNRVRVVDVVSGTIRTFAGTAAAEHSGDGGPADGAGVHGARAVKVAADGTVYILERQGSTLRAVDPNTGIITTVAGTGARAYEGDGGPALAAAFNAPKELAIDRAGNLLIVDTENHALRLVDIGTRTVVTIAGSGRQGGDGDGGPAGAAALDRPHGAAVAADGSIYIGDTNNHRIRKLAPA